MVPRPTQAQMEALAVFLEKNPGIAKGILRSNLAKMETKKKWKAVASYINSLGGAQKDGPGWAKYWAEKKCILKKQYAQRAQSTSDDRPLDNLTPLELRLVAVMGSQSNAAEDSQVAIDPLAQQSESQSIQIERSPSPNSSYQDVKNVENLEVQSNGSQEYVYDATEPREIPSLRYQRSQNQNNRSQSDSSSNCCDRLFRVLDRFQRIEEKRLESDLTTAQALNAASSNLNNCANAIRESSQLVANALMEIARRLPEPAE